MSSTPPQDLPRHVAIIMDGNGRWATSRGLTRIQGHRKGKDSVREVVETAREIGIEYLTLYAFSSENWQRPQREVSALMRLLRRYLKTELKKMMRYEIRLRAIGNLRKLPSEIVQEIRHVEAETRKNQRMTVVLAVSYGSRDEIIKATRKLARQVRDGAIAPEQIDDDIFSDALMTGGIPDPDLLIRTSGEMRLSNFLLWQVAYSELYVTPILWPDFRRDQFMEAMEYYKTRDRRFGLTGEQMAELD